MQYVYSAYHSVCVCVCVLWVCQYGISQAGHEAGSTSLHQWKFRATSPCVKNASGMPTIHTDTQTHTYVLYTYYRVCMVDLCSSNWSVIA